jgi:alcohol dehydrogenase
LVRSGQLEPQKFITYRFPLSGILDAYDVFSRATDTGALKVVLHK